MIQDLGFYEMLSETKSSLTQLNPNYATSSVTPNKDYLMNKSIETKRLTHFNKTLKPLTSNNSP